MTHQPARPRSRDRHVGLAAVLLALILVIGVYPLTGILRRRGVPMWLAVTITLIAVLALILGLAAALALSVAQLATILPTYQDSFDQLVDDLRSRLASLGVGQDQIRAALDQISFSSIASLLGGVLAGLASTFSNLLFLLFVVVFMALDAVGFSGRLSRARRQRAEVVGALDTFVHGTRGYLLVSTVFGLIVGHRHRLPLAGRSAATGAVGTAGLHHELHSQRRVHHRGGPTRAAGPARGRTPADDHRDRGLLGDQFHHPVDHPAEVRVGRRQSLAHADVPLAGLLVVRDRPLGAVLAIPLTLLAKALLLDVDPNTRWISSLLVGGPVPPEEMDSSKTPESEPDASADPTVVTRSQ